MNDLETVKRQIRKHDEWSDEGTQLNFIFFEKKEAAKYFPKILSTIFDELNVLYNEEEYNYFLKENLNTYVEQQKKPYIVYDLSSSSDEKEFYKNLCAVGTWYNDTKPLGTNVMMLIPREFTNATTSFYHWHLRTASYSDLDEEVCYLMEKEKIKDKLEKELPNQTSTQTKNKV